MIRSTKIRSLTIDLPPQIFISANIDHVMWMSVSHFLRIILTAYHSFSWSSPESLEDRPLWKIANHKPHHATLVVFSHWENVLSEVMFSCENMNELINLSCFSRAVDKSPPALSTITITISLSPWLQKQRKQVRRNFQISLFLSTHSGSQLKRQTTEWQQAGALGLYKLQIVNFITAMNMFLAK